MISDGSKDLTWKTTRGNELVTGKFEKLVAYIRLHEFH